MCLESGSLSQRGECTQGSRLSSRDHKGRLKGSEAPLPTDEHDISIGSRAPLLTDENVCLESGSLSQHGECTQGSRLSSRDHEGRLKGSEAPLPTDEHDISIGSGTPLLTDENKKCQ